MSNTNRKFLWDDCHSIEEQRARVFRRWLADPKGTYDERWSNEKLVRLAIEFWIQPLFMRSADKNLHEYWSDGIKYFECTSRDFTDLRFAGTSFFSDRHARHMWYAPFEFDVRYQSLAANIPSDVRLRFGEPDPTFPIARIPLGETDGRKQLAMDIHSRRPVNTAEWAVSLTFDPYVG